MISWRTKFNKHIIITLLQVEDDNLETREYPMSGWLRVKKNYTNVGTNIHLIPVLMRSLMFTGMSDTTLSNISWLSRVVLKYCISENSPPYSDFNDWNGTHTHTRFVSLTHSLTLCICLSVSLSLCLTLPVSTDVEFDVCGIPSTKVKPEDLRVQLLILGYIVLCYFRFLFQKKPELNNVKVFFPFRDEVMSSSDIWYVLMSHSNIRTPGPVPINLHNFQIWFTTNTSWWVVSRKGSGTIMFPGDYHVFLVCDRTPDKNTDIPNSGTPARDDTHTEKDSDRDNGRVITSVWQETHTRLWYIWTRVTRYGCFPKSFLKFSFSLCFSSSPLCVSLPPHFVTPLFYTQYVP